MALQPEPKPKLRFFIAWPRSDGSVGMTPWIADIEEAEQRRKQGFALVGPDPHDEIALAAWQRETYTQDDGA